MQNLLVAIPLLILVMVFSFLAIFKSQENEARNWLIACFIAGILLLSQAIDINISIVLLKEAPSQLILLGFPLAAISLIFGILHLIIKK
jgi:hypothetical protein